MENRFLFTPYFIPKKALNHYLKEFSRKNRKDPSTTYLTHSKDLSAKKTQSLQMHFPIYLAF